MGGVADTGEVSGKQETGDELVSVCDIFAVFVNVCEILDACFCGAWVVLSAQRVLQGVGGSLSQGHVNVMDQ